MPIDNINPIKQSQRSTQDFISEETGISSTSRHLGKSLLKKLSDSSKNITGFPSKSYIPNFKPANSKEKLIPKDSPVDQIKSNALEKLEDKEIDHSVPLADEFDEEEIDLSTPFGEYDEQEIDFSIGFEVPVVSVANQIIDVPTGWTLPVNFDQDLVFSGLNNQTGVVIKNRFYLVPKGVLNVGDQVNPSMPYTNNNGSWYQFSQGDGFIEIDQCVLFEVKNESGKYNDAVIINGKLYLEENIAGDFKQGSICNIDSHMYISTSARTMLKLIPNVAGKLVPPSFVRLDMIPGDVYDATGEGDWGLMDKNGDFFAMEITRGMGPGFFLTDIKTQGNTWRVVAHGPRVHDFNSDYVKPNHTFEPVRLGALKAPPSEKH